MRSLICIDEPHVVLDQEDRHAAIADAPDQLDQLALLARVHPGRRFVEQQQLRLARERARDLEPALHPVGQVARVLLGDALEPDEAQQFARALAHAPLFGALRAACAAASRAAFARMPRVLAGHHVVERRHEREQPDVLKRARDAAGARSRSSAAAEIVRPSNAIRPLLGA